MPFAFANATPTVRPAGVAKLAGSNSTGSVKSASSGELLNPIVLITCGTAAPGCESAISKNRFAPSAAVAVTCAHITVPAAKRCASAVAIRAVPFAGIFNDVAIPAGETVSPCWLKYWIVTLFVAAAPFTSVSFVT